MLTVIVPHFHCATYLAESVASVLVQTYRNLRLVVADDHSPDDDWITALAPWKGDRRLTLLRASRNVGPLRLKNVVIESVSTPYIGFQDADDVSEPDRFARQLAVLERGRADLVGCGYRIIDAQGNSQGVRHMPRNGNLVHRLGRKTIALHPATVVRREVFTRLSGFDGTADFGSDTDFQLRVAWLYRIRNLRSPLYRYRAWAASLTAAPTTGFGSPARDECMRRMAELEQRRRHARGRAERLPLLVAPPNDVSFDLHVVA
jgi:glycosyltransferase involved in cell wall biosynthesis